MPVAQDYALDLELEFLKSFAAVVDDMHVGEDVGAADPDLPVKAASHDDALRAVASMENAFV